MDFTERGYSLREVLDELGCSDSWLRKRIRSGSLGTVERVKGSRGLEYRFTPEQVDTLRDLYGSGAAAAPGSAIVASKRELVALTQAVRVEAERWKAVAEERAERVSSLETEAAQRLAERDAERERLEKAQQRIEDLKALSVWDVLRGKLKEL